jgi:hypothetical protein
MSISHDFPPTGDACILSWGERVVVDRALVGYVLETFEGFSAFTAIGALVGVFQRKYEAVAALNARAAR